METTTAVMHERDTGVNGAMLFLADHHKEVENKFFDARRLCQHGKPVDSQVTGCVETMNGALRPRGILAPRVQKSKGRDGIR